MESGQTNINNVTNTNKEENNLLGTDILGMDLQFTSAPQNNQNLDLLGLTTNSKQEKTQQVGTLNYEQLLQLDQPVNKNKNDFIFDQFN